MTSMVGLALGDCIAQASTGCCDPMRTARMALFGATLHGPCGHLWYKFLDAKVMPEQGTSTPAIVSKMVLDQAVFAPVFTAIFYAVITALEGRPDSIMEVLQSKLLPTVFAGYALWPIAHLVSFKFVPSEYRLLYINAVNLVWTIHLSKLASAPPDIAAVHATPDVAMGTPQCATTYPSIPVSLGGEMIVPQPAAIVGNMPHQA